MRTPIASLRNSDGYSLLELLTVVVLVGILSGLAVPSLQGYLSRQRAQRALNTMAADVHYGRMLAVRDGRSVRIRASAADGYVVERVLAGGQTEQLKRVVLSMEFPGTQFDLPSQGIQLEFTPRGLLRDAEGELFIKVANSNVRDSIFVSPAGRVYRAY